VNLHQLYGLDLVGWHGNSYKANSFYQKQLALTNFKI